MSERICLIVNFKNPKVLKHLKKYGNLAYYHKKRRYAVLYINATDESTTINALSKERYVRNVEISQLDNEQYQLNFDVK